MKLAEAVGGLDAAANSAFGAINAAIRNLAEVARTSDLTGLLNTLALEQDFADIQRDLTPYHILFGDLNGFKNINDTYEHAAGDAALRWAGTLLKTVVRNWNATAYHKSGDEFVILVPSSHKRHLIEDLQQYFARMSLPFEYRDHEVVLQLSGSFGCAAIDQMDLSNALRVAETACQIAKHRGSEYVVHEAVDGEQLETRERRFRCNRCGTSVRCVLTGEHRERMSLVCPVCPNETVSLADDGSAA